MDTVTDFKQVNITEISPATYNPRKISNEEYNKLSKSISEFGVISPIIVNMKNMHIIGGHQRYDVLYDEYLDNGSFEELNLIQVGDIGWVFPSTDIKIDDLSQEKAMNLALNKISGEWDIPKLENLLIDLDVDEYDLDLTGFDKLDFEEFDIDLKTNIKLPDPQEELKKELEKEEPVKEKNKKEYEEQQKDVKKPEHVNNDYLNDALKESDDLTELKDDYKITILLSTEEEQVELYLKLKEQGYTCDMI